MGKGKKIWPQELRELWVSGEGLNPDWRRVRLSCTEKYFWKAPCGKPKHYRIAQPATVYRALGLDKASSSNGGGSSASSGGGSGGGNGGGSGGSRWRCFICDALQTQLSRHVPAVQAAASSSAQLWVPEVHCLEGRFSPADLWLPLLRLAVQIDGAGHQFVQVYSKTLEQQQHTDWRFDNETVRQGLRALRLHYRDTADSKQVERELAAAIQRCEKEPAAAFVLYSRSYHRPAKTTVDAEYLEEVGSGSGGSSKRQRQQ